MNHNDAHRQLDDLQPQPTFEWVRLIRRSALDPTVKLTALMLASYADPDGSRIWPGMERLALVTGRSVATVRRHVSELRDLGFVTRVRQGNRKAGKADEYRLSVSIRELHAQLQLGPDEVMYRPPVSATGCASSAHLKTSSAHSGGSVPLTHERPPTQAPTTTNPIGSVSEVTHLPAPERREKTIPRMGDDYRPTSPAYAQWRATRRSG